MHRDTDIGEILDAWHRIKHALTARFAHHTCLPHSQWSVLNALLERTSQETTVKDVATVLAITGSAATQLINVLVAKGYIGKKPHPKDKRHTLIFLTPMCTRAMKQMRTDALAQSKDLFDKLTDAELKTYARITKKIM